MYTEGVKFDTDKPRMDLVPPVPMLELGKLYAIGGQKYDDRNWEKGMAWGRVIGALERHFLKWKAGESIDPETGVSHLIAVIWNAIALFEYERRGIGEDDRGLDER